MKAALPERRLRLRGYSLLELMVVMVVLGLIASMATPRVIRYLEKSKIKAADLQLNAVATGLELFYLDIGRFPTESEGLEALIRPKPAFDSWDGPYVSKSKTLIDPWGQSLVYRQSGSGMQSFELLSLGADNREGGEGAAADILYNQ